MGLRSWIVSLGVLPNEGLEKLEILIRKAFDFKPKFHGVIMWKNQHYILLSTYSPSPGSDVWKKYPEKVIQIREGMFAYDCLPPGLDEWKRSHGEVFLLDEVPLDKDHKIKAAKYLNMEEIIQFLPHICSFQKTLSDIKQREI